MVKEAFEKFLIELRIDQAIKRKGGPKEVPEAQTSEVFSFLNAVVGEVTMNCFPFRGHFIPSLRKEQTTIETVIEKGSILSARI